RVPPPHDLHVLLRHRLLRQPGGFEGGVATQSQRVKRTFLGQVNLAPDESSVPEPAAVIDVAFKRHAARASLCPPASMHKDAIIANRPGVLDRVPVTLPGPRNLGKKA